MFDSYLDSLNKLKESIPENYILKKKLQEKINYCINDMIYKPPELLPEYFTYYCNLIIPLLPEQKEENNWVIKPWENIHIVAKNNNKNFRNSSN
jgi:hypothetical protein